MDLCSGTGDLAIELARMTSPDTAIIAADFCQPMLDVAKNKAVRYRLDNRIGFQIADAASLPFDDGYFDLISIAFGFRNLTFKNPDTDIFLAEIFRTIAPGGRLVVVETSQPESVWLKKLSALYYSLVVKPAGSFISGDGGAYSYLAYSAKNYFRPTDVSRLLTNAGFVSVEYRPLWAGVAAIHAAVRP